MSIYDGRPYACACGAEHEFASYLPYKNYVSSGVNAKMVVPCPDHPEFTTLIETKHRFVFKFDKFVSLVGCKSKEFPL
jgi:hypothetical protein